LSRIALTFPVQILNDADIDDAVRGLNIEFGYVDGECTTPISDEHIKAIHRMMSTKHITLEADVHRDGSITFLRVL
jgi:hypothetical protein